MTYIKPPTQKEKEEYWTTAKDIILLFTYIIIGIVAIGTFGYLFYKHTYTILYWTLISLLFIAIASLTLSISTIFAACYSQLYTSWHMIHKRHRTGYYSSYINSLILSLLSTIVIIIVVFCTYYDIFTNAFKMQDNNMFTIGLKIAVAILIIFISVTAIYSILDIRKEKPALPPITEQEQEDREYLKSIYYYILEEKGFEYIRNEIYYEKFNYLAILDFYMNHDGYEYEQVKKWKYDIYHENLTVNKVFKEISEINKTKDEKLYQEVSEKAKKEIEKLILNKYDYIRNDKNRLKEHFNEYLD